MNKSNTGLVKLATIDMKKSANKLTTLLAQYGYPAAIAGGVGGLAGLGLSGLTGGDKSSGLGAGALAALLGGAGAIAPLGTGSVISNYGGSISPKITKALLSRPSRIAALGGLGAILGSQLFKGKKD